MDAMTLSMSSAVSMRFWLEFLNLSWGDFIAFDPALAEENAERPQKMRFQRFRLRFPAQICLLLVFALWSLGYVIDIDLLNAGASRCTVSFALAKIGTIAMGFIIVGSFFYWVRGLAFLSLSPYLRQIHQVTRYIFRGEKPPKMLYVTDGGVQDCTAINQLIMRKCERILLVQAPADAGDDFAVLKHAMGVAKEHQMCCFYDPQDPRIDIWDLKEGAFSRFKRDRSIPYLHIGIYYHGSADGKELSKVGHLFIVKNRLPPSQVGHPIEPPLSEGEICRGEQVEWDATLWKDLTTDKLGPFGCCDCCHTRLGWNCGPKFPHGNFSGYLFLTPKWFSSLVRLSYGVCEDAIAKVTAPGFLAQRWEEDILRDGRP
jgi:hypothetical protein